MLLSPSIYYKAQATTEKLSLSIDMVRSSGCGSIGERKLTVKDHKVCALTHTVDPS